MPNSELAAVLLEESLSWGVRNFVVCAGARNAPLVLPLLDAPDQIRIWNHFDERSAAFFALGLAKRNAEPVAIVTTSGTAVAELLPATIEAHFSGIPLVLITADRPKRFRGTGAPQSILQPGLFGEYVEGSFDCESPEEFPRGFPWNRARPIHLNPCFEEPGSEPAAEIDWTGAMAARVSVSDLLQPSSFGDPALLDRFVADFEGGVVLLGELRRKDRGAVEQFLERLGAAVWAEATSGLRESPALADLLIRGGDRALKVLGPAKVLRIGGVPSLRFWRDLENLPAIPVLSVTRTGFSGLARPSEVTGWIDFAEVTLSGGSKPAPELPNWEDSISDWSASEPGQMRLLSGIIPEEAQVFLGNSLPIRLWNLAADEKRRHSEVFANRGANGIDGEISTFLGLSEGVEESWGIFGDLTALYDLSAPWVLDQLSAGKRRIVVINNGGGRIFSRLPAFEDLDAKRKNLIENRHRMNFSMFAALWNLEYRCDCDVNGRSPAGLADHALIEVTPDEKSTQEFWNWLEES